MPIPKEKIPPLAYTQGAPVVDPPAGYGQSKLPVSSGTGSGGNKVATEAVVAGITAAVQLIGIITSAVSQHRANQTNIDLTRYAYDQNLLQWQRENAYNSPLAQRQRLLAAGLNPGLMYQNGTAGGASASSPEMDSTEVEPLFNGSTMGSSPSDIGSAYMQNRLLQEQIRAQQLQNDITEETRPTVVGNLRKEGELLSRKITSEDIIQALNSTRNYNAHMDELRAEARFAMESDKFDLEWQDAEETIRGKEIDNNFKEAANEITLQIMRNNKNISDAQAKEASYQIVVIDAMNEQMAQDQYLIDNYYPLYVAQQTNHSLRGNAYKSDGTMSPGEWLETLSADVRSTMLSRSSSIVKGHYIPAYKDAKNSERYKNLYWKRLNQSKINTLVQGYYNGSSSSSSFGASAFGFGVNTQ